MSWTARCREALSFARTKRCDRWNGQATRKPHRCCWDRTMKGADCPRGAADALALRLCANQSRFMGSISRIHTGGLT